MAEKTIAEVFQAAYRKVEETTGTMSFDGEAQAGQAIEQRIQEYMPPYTPIILKDVPPRISAQPTARGVYVGLPIEPNPNAFRVLFHQEEAMLERTPLGLSCNNNAIWFSVPSVTVDAVRRYTTIAQEMIRQLNEGVAAYTQWFRNEAGGLIGRRFDQVQRNRTEIQNLIRELGAKADFFDPTEMS